MTDWLDDRAIGAALLDLGDHVALPTHSCWPGVRAALDDERAGAPARRWPVWVAVGAAILVVLVAVVSIAPARRAVADFLGIGTTEVRRVDAAPEGAAPGTLPTRGNVGELRDAMRRAGLALPDAALTGAPRAWEIDPGGETVVAFQRVVLSQREEGAVPALKQVPRGTGVEPARVGALGALWIDGPHTRAVDGRALRSASALLWIDDGVELRLEGDLPLEKMEAIARSVRPVR